MKSRGASLHLDHVELLLDALDDARGQGGVVEVLSVFLAVVRGPAQEVHNELGLLRRGDVDDGPVGAAARGRYLSRGGGRREAQGVRGFPQGGGPRARG